MKCTKCGGLMVLQSFFDHFLNFEGWKCLNCGKIVVKKEKTLEYDSFSMFYQQQKMQKQKLTPEFFLAFQATYDNYEIGLFDQLDCIDMVQEDKILASRNFILLLESLLRRNNVSLEDLNFIAVNQGPGYFLPYALLWCQLMV